MNNLKIIAICLLCLATLLPACKKGEDDPGLSFRSRDARITGNWMVISSAISVEIRNVNTNLEDNTIRTTITNNNIDFDGSTYITSTHQTVDNKVEIDTFITDSISYSIDYHFMENGDFLKEILKIYPNGRRLTVNHHGSWSWANNSKNKSAVDINIGDNEVLHYIIPELRNESMRLEINSEHSEKFKRDRPNPHADDRHIHRTTTRNEVITLEKR